MSTKKRVSYQKLLKEAIAEYDTTKTVDVKGPMLDPILSYAGGGELPTHKDAASILERYYFLEFFRFWNFAGNLERACFSCCCSSQCLEQDNQC